jgi:hypothetical protein
MHEIRMKAKPLEPRPPSLAFPDERMWDRMV